MVKGPCRTAADPRAPPGLGTEMLDTQKLPGQLLQESSDVRSVKLGRQERKLNCALLRR